MKVLKSWGTSGEVVVSLYADDPRDLDLDKPVFIEFDGLPVPFFIEHYAPKGGRLIVKFEDIDSFEASEELVGRLVALSADGDDDDDDEGLVGLRVISASDGVLVGEIVDYNDYAGNLCISVLRSDGSEVELPLHEDLIVSSDDDSLTLTIPSGLL